MQRCESDSHGSRRQVQADFSFVQNRMRYCAMLRTSKIQDYPHVRTRLGKDMTVTSVTLPYPGRVLPHISMCTCNL